METSETKTTGKTLTLKDIKNLFGSIEWFIRLCPYPSGFPQGVEKRKEALKKIFGEENSMTNGQAMELPDSTELRHESLEKYQALNRFFFDNMGKTS